MTKEHRIERVESVISRRAWRRRTRIFAADPSLCFQLTTQISHHPMLPPSLVVLAANIISIHLTIRQHHDANIETAKLPGWPRQQEEGCCSFSDADRILLAHSPPS
jgi:hypothetical protein